MLVTVPYRTLYKISAAACVWRAHLVDGVTDGGGGGARELLHVLFDQGKADNRSSFRGRGPTVPGAAQSREVSEQYPCKRTFRVLVALRSMMCAASPDWMSLMVLVALSRTPTSAEVRCQLRERCSLCPRLPSTRREPARAL